MGSSPVFFCRDAPPMGAFFLRQTLEAAKLCPVPLEYNGSGQSFFSFVPDWKYENVYNGQQTI